MIHNRTVQDTRETLRTTMDAYNRSPHYGTALALQQAEWEFRMAVEANRKAVVVIHTEAGTTLPSEHERAVAALQEIWRSLAGGNNDQGDAEYARRVAENVLKGLGHLPATTYVDVMPWIEEEYIDMSGLNSHE